MQQSPWCPRTVGGSKQDCAVCMDVCGSEGGAIKLGCSHSFCRQCIATHAARQVLTLPQLLHTHGAPHCSRPLAAATVAALRT